jgi:hypothetical protein
MYKEIRSLLGGSHRFSQMRPTGFCSSVFFANLLHPVITIKWGHIA